MKLRKPRNPVSQYAHKRKAGPHIDRKKEENKNRCRVNTITKDNRPAVVCTGTFPEMCVLYTKDNICDECWFYEENQENNNDDNDGDWRDDVVWEDETW